MSRARQDEFERAFIKDLPLNPEDKNQLAYKKGSWNERIHAFFHVEVKKRESYIYRQKAVDALCQAREAFIQEVKGTQLQDEKAKQLPQKLKDLNTKFEIFKVIDQLAEKAISLADLSKEKGALKSQAKGLYQTFADYLKVPEKLGALNQAMATLKEKMPASSAANDYLFTADPVPPGGPSEGRLHMPDDEHSAKDSEFMLKVVDEVPAVGGGRENEYSKSELEHENEYSKSELDHEIEYSQSERNLDNEDLEQDELPSQASAKESKEEPRSGRGGPGGPKG